jgi:hypothetical protein
MRRIRARRRNGRRVMKNFGVYDIESNHWNRFEVMGCFDGVVYRKFTRIADFLDYIDQRKYRDFKWYAHNGGRFDVNFMLEPCLSRYHCTFPSTRDGMIIQMLVEGRRVKWEFRDSIAMLPGKLKDLGKAFQTEHQKKDMDVAHGVSKSDLKLLSYLENDCMCLFEILEKFFASDFVVDEPKLTIASQSLDTFRKKFLGAHKLDELNVFHERDIRSKFYAGGRVEVFKGYGSRVTGYDVNSLYPSVMLNEMPAGIAVQTRSYDRRKIGFYQVRIKNTPPWYVSPLLVKVPHGKVNENYYTTGDGVYCASSETLNFIRQEFAVRFDVLVGYVFPKREHLFNGYVEHYYSIKKNATDPAMRYLAKLSLNSLYGKFGMDRDRDRIQQMTNKIFRVGGYRTLNEEYGLVLTVEKTRSKFVLPYLAAYITDLARLRHFQIMNTDQNSLYYCDTDSLFTDNPQAFNKFVGDEIGQLSCLGEFTGLFIAPKTYALKSFKRLKGKRIEKVCFKGFEAKKFSFKQFHRALTEGLELSEKRERFCSILECAEIERMKADKIVSRRKVIYDEGPFLKVVLSEKKVRSKYEKRAIIPDGKHIFETRPLTFDEVMKPDVKSMFKNALHK